MTYYPPGSTILQNFSPIVQTIYEICVTKVFSTFWLRGLTPGPTFTKRGEDLADYEVYQPAKFHRSRPTRARGIRYQNSCGHTKNRQTVTDISTTCRSACVDNKQTVNDISTACLSACVDNKYASCPDWRISPHADRRSPITAIHK